MRVFLILSLFMLGFASYGTENNDFEKIKEEFAKGFNGLNIPFLQISYADNLNAIRDIESINAQEEFFTEFKSRLSRITVKNLSEDDHISHQVLLYECELNLERIQLEKQWVSNSYKVNGTKLYEESMGKDWYAYFIKKWVDKDFTPDDAYQFGLEEIESVKSKMNEIQERSGMTKHEFQEELSSPKFLITDKELIKSGYDALNQLVKSKARAFFPKIDQIQDAKIAAGDNEAMAIAPAYYANNTFYFNFFNGSYNARNMSWIYIHEAVPGHHYQNRYMAMQQETVRNLFWYPGFVEGWGAYVEQFGEQLGAYSTPMDEYGQLEWDLVRSVRVSLDVALNYYGWSDEKALEFWRQHIPDQDDIAEREIARMKRWPAQVITYKYGKRQFDQLKGDKKSPAELKAFHTDLLKHGVIPLSVLENYMTDKS